jgi:hypothetical protein
MSERSEHTSDARERVIRPSIRLSAYVPHDAGERSEAAA